jgi:type IV pilus assembly protein PilM
LRELTVSNKSIGIDLGSRAVKAVVAAKRGTSVSIKSFIEVPIERNGAPQTEQVAAALGKIGKQLEIGSELVVTSVSTQQTTVRNLEIPFSDEEKARQILKFQTEPYLAFPIEEVIIDFYDTKTSAEGKMKVLLTAVHKGVIENHLKLLARAGIDPEVVDADFMGMASAALWAEPALKADSGIVMDIGDSKTIACYIERGKLLGVRSHTVGGEDFTEAIAKEVGVSYEEAEQLKTGKTYPGAPQDAPQKVSQAINSVFERLGPELDRTVRYFSSQARGGSFNRVFLSGGSATLSGLDKFLSESLSAKVSLLSCPEGVKGDFAEPAVFARFATATGLALRGLGESPCHQNFRQEEHAYSRPLRRLKKHLILTAVLPALIAVLLVFSLFASIDRHNSRKADLEYEIQKIRRTIFLGKNPRTNADVRKLLDEERNTLTPFRELKGGISILQILEDVATKLPGGMTAEFALFNYTKGRPAEFPTVGQPRRTPQTTPTWDATVTLKGTAPSVQAHVQLKEILEELDYVALVEDKGTTDAGGGRVNVEYILRLKASRIPPSTHKEMDS